MHGELEENIKNVESVEYNSNDVKLDVIEDVKITNFKYDVEEELVIINCTVTFTVYVDHSYYVGSREPSIELPSTIECQVNACVYFDIFSGEHNEQIKLIDIDLPMIELDEVEVISSTDPLAHEDDFQEQPEPDYDMSYIDELEAEYERMKEQRESDFANEEHISVEEIEADIEDRLRQKEFQDEYEAMLRETEDEEDY